MEFRTVLVSFLAAVPHHVDRLIHFGIHNIHIAMIIMGLGVLVSVALISIFKRIFFPDASIIRSAHEKKLSVAAKLREAKEKRAAQGTVRAAQKPSRSKKKYILVPQDEWQEFIEYKKQHKKTVSQPSGAPRRAYKLRTDHSGE